MIRKEKGFELMKIIFITNLSTFGSKMFLTLKIMDFENVHVTKVIHVYMIEGMNAQYIWYKNQLVVKIYLYKKYCVKRNIRNKKIINYKPM